MQHHVIAVLFEDGVYERQKIDRFTGSWRGSTAQIGSDGNLRVADNTLTILTALSKDLADVSS
jgi:hypothetical protein